MDDGKAIVKLTSSRGSDLSKLAANTTRIISRYVKLGLYAGSGKVCQLMPRRLLYLDTP